MLPFVPTYELNFDGKEARVRRGDAVTQLAKSVAWPTVLPELPSYIGPLVSEPREGLRPGAAATRIAALSS